MNSEEKKDLENISNPINTEEKVEKSAETINEETINPEDIKLDQQPIEIEEKYKFGWSKYAELTNGRFAMLGFLAIILIELFSQKSFLNWAGIFN